MKCQNNNCSREAILQITREGKEPLITCSVCATGYPVKDITGYMEEKK